VWVGQSGAHDVMGRREGEDERGDGG